MEPEYCICFPVYIMLNFIVLRPFKLYHKQKKNIDDFFFHTIELHAAVISVKFIYALHFSDLEKSSVLAW